MLSPLMTDDCGSVCRDATFVKKSSTWKLIVLLRWNDLQHSSTSCFAKDKITTRSSRGDEKAASKLR